MSIQRKLRAWERAGVIDAATRERIQKFEDERARPWALYVVGGLGALAVVLGVISMIAANWDDIPRLVKIALDLAIMGGLAVAVLRADDNEQPWTREMLLLVFFGLALASVGLVGQAYNLGGTVWMALLTWSLMTLPAMLLLGSSAVAASAMLAAVNGSLSTSLVEWLDRAHLGKFYEVLIGVVVFGMLPLAHIMLSHSERLRRWRPDVARVAGALGWGAVLWASAVAQQLWYASSSLSGDELQAALLGLVPVLAATAWVIVDLRRAMAGHSGMAVLGWRVLLGYAVVMGVLPPVVPHGTAGLPAVLSFLAYCAVVAWAAYHRGQVWLFNVATSVLGMRLLGVFVELFGGLMLTGAGLVVSGVLALVAARLWVAKTREFRAVMRGGGGAP